MAPVWPKTSDSGFMSHHKEAGTRCSSPCYVGSLVLETIECSSCQVLVRKAASFQSKAPQLATLDQPAWCPKLVRGKSFPNPKSEFRTNKASAGGGGTRKWIFLWPSWEHRKGNQSEEKGKPLPEKDSHLKVLSHYSLTTQHPRHATKGHVTVNPSSLPLTWYPHWCHSQYLVVWAESGSFGSLTGRYQLSWFSQGEKGKSEK